MEIVLITHPDFVESRSMQRFANALASSYRERGHVVQKWTAPSILSRLTKQPQLRKWLGYFDQFVLFPPILALKVRRQSAQTVFVICDQALGPWVPYIQSRRHAIHVHDLMALKSALGLVQENPTSWSGRMYQKYIKWGFSQGRKFICISGKTKSDLVKFASIDPALATVVYNSVAPHFRRIESSGARKIIEDELVGFPESPFLLHVSGGQWYKNVDGVIAIWKRLASNELLGRSTILLLIGRNMQDIVTRNGLADELGRTIFCYPSISDEGLTALYSSMVALLFPSLDEGFGWPIIEAQVCGGMVVTTAEAPMNEICGKYACTIPRLKWAENVDDWAAVNVPSIFDALRLYRSSEHMAENMQAIADRFNSDAAIDAYLSVYAQTVADSI